MKFQLIVWGLFNFLHTYDSANFKSIGNNTMKKILATALFLITGCAQQTFTVQNKPAAVAPKETITHHFFVSGIGTGEENCRCSQNLCWRRKYC